VRVFYLEGTPAPSGEGTTNPSASSIQPLLAVQYDFLTTCRSQDLKDFRIENGSSQAQYLGLTGSSDPRSLDSGMTQSVAADECG
jgi:hypothetical protein